MEDAGGGGSAQRADAPSAESEEPPMREVRINGNPNYTYAIKEKLGEGGFGKVYVAERTLSTGAKDRVAVKFELITNEQCEKSPNEWEVYKALCDVDGVPRMHHYDSQREYNITVMDLLGPSLRDYRNKTLDKASEEWVKTVKYVAIEAIKVLESVHSKGYLHGDIKPSNLLLCSHGTSEQKLFLVDFGLATTWKDGSGNHVEYDQKPSIIRFSGTADYASVHTHLGRTRSRRDDLESLAYTLICLLCGDLPWKEHKGDNRKFLVCKEKMSTSPESLCCSLPQGMQPFKAFFEYVIQLKFDEEPEYKKCRSLFEDPEGQKTQNGSILKQVPLQVRTRKPSTQWISVYDARKPMRQRYHYGVETGKLGHFTEKGKEENLLISSVASCEEDQWALIIDAGTGFSDQIYEHLPSFPDESWRKKKLDEGYRITAIAGSKNGSSLVVMSKGTRYDQQAFHIDSLFPYQWIRGYWAIGFHITSIATTESQWAVVMSHSAADADLEQVIELDFAYPFEGIHQRWKKGFHITVTAATPELAAFVFTKKKSTDKPSRRQDTRRTSEFPGKRIKENWARDLYVSSLCYGRTIS